MGILLTSYVMIFLLSPKDITDYTIADTKYWGETENRLMLKTVYEYNNKEDIQGFPRNLGEWNGYDYRYSDIVYKILKADILMSRAYKKSNESVIWMDIIHSKVGESFHNQKICLEGAGWNIDNESTAEFKIADPPNPFTRLYANKLEYSKNDQKQIMVYWFMFKKFGSKDDVSMIRISTPVVSNETHAFNNIKDFIEDDLFYAMYRKAEPETTTVAEDIIKTHGNVGILAIAAGVFLPAGLVIAGMRRKD